MAKAVCFTPYIDVLQHKPTLEALVQLVVTLVAYRWEELAIYLDVNPGITKAIKGSDRVTAEGHCREMLTEWLSTTGTEVNSMMGRKPRTWASIFQAIDKSIGSEVGKDVKKQLFPNPSPEGQSPTVRICMS